MSSHESLRELAFQSNAAGLRAYGAGVLKKNPDRLAASEVLDLMAYLVDCDFVGAEAKLSTIKFKFKSTSDEVYVDEATNLAQAHIDFAFGRFESMELAAHAFLESHKNVPNLEEGEFLDVLRLLAQKHLIMDEFEKLYAVYDEILKYKTTSNEPNLLYLIESVHAMKLLAEGEFIKAFEVANRNLQIAKQKNYKGLMAPIDSMYVAAGALQSQAKIKEGAAVFVQIAELAKISNLWPWYFVSDGNISRDLARKGAMSHALAAVREERDLLASFNFSHQLNFMPDVNEMYVRFLINDMDRLEILLERVPPLVIVRQIKAFYRELQGQDMLKWIEGLPEKTPKEKIYKNLALSDYYREKESIAVDYMVQVLAIVEKTGAAEMVLHQFGMVEIILKAIAKKPTVFLEGLASQLAERVRLRNLQNRDGLEVPLTTRELEVVRHLSTGNPISAIATTLHVSLNTMKTHLRNVYRKLDVDGREGAVKKAQELFLI